MDKIKIYVLVDNTASPVCKAEHGLSYLIEFDKKVLFDTGNSDLFLKNALLIDAPVKEIDAIVLSHGHYDHGNGLKYLKNKRLIGHPGIFQKRFSGKQKKYVGIDSDKETASEQFKLELSKQPVWISDNMVFLGEIPRKTNFEKTATRFTLSGGSQDKLLDDSALVITMDKGLFIVSGCAHAGICNIIEYARKVTNVEKIYGVMGGFHLKFNNEQTKKTIDYFLEINPKIVMPSHCTELPALGAFYEIFKGEQVKAGTLYTFEN